MSSFRKFSTIYKVQILQQDKVIVIFGFFKYSLFDEILQFLGLENYLIKDFQRTE